MWRVQPSAFFMAAVTAFAGVRQEWRVGTLIAGYAPVQVVRGVTFGPRQSTSLVPMLRYRYTVARLAPMIFPISAGARPWAFRSRARLTNA